MNIDELQHKYAMPGVLAFEKTSSGLVAAHVTAPAAEATIYTQGAHLTHWKPKGMAPAIFVSARAEYAPGKPIRGGVPVIFPWFAERHDGKAGPQHGFARISEWELAFAAMSGDELHLAWTLEPNELSRELGFDHFKLGYRMTIGRKLTLELTVANDSGNGGARAADASKEQMEALGAPLVFEEALHTYYAVADVQKVSIEGLGGTEYIDKVDGNKRKKQTEDVLRLTGRTDRPYLNTTATCVLRDEVGARRITVAKSGSKSTVVWNPWKESTANMADMEPDGWLHMTAIETANVGEDAVTLKAGAAHTMRAEISVEALG
jgi:glucose-6-phosphate 1-epimerase